MSIGNPTYPTPWRKGEHRFSTGQQVVDATGHEIAWIRYNDSEVVDAMVAAPEMLALLREWRGYPGPVHGDCDCLYCRTMRVLARIDREKAA